MIARYFLLVACAAALLGGGGCRSGKTHIVYPHEAAKAANQLFLAQKNFDPWILTSEGNNADLPLYVSDGHIGCLIDSDGQITQTIKAGNYKAGVLQKTLTRSGGKTVSDPVQETLDMHTGKYTIQNKDVSLIAPGLKQRNWSKLWSKSDIVIGGDSEAQQAVHANMFYLLSSTYPGSMNSIPPMGLSSTAYDGHIFWDADVWMLPALLVQHPEDARSIVDYRYHRLNAAVKYAAYHKYPGGEYPWESADTGYELARPEFATERHITADVAYGAWQYYLWTGDAAYLKHTVWPILRTTAAYWAARPKKYKDGTYHIEGILPPDETAGIVNDDVYTNAGAQYNMIAASKAAALVGAAADPKWKAVAAKLVIPYDNSYGIPSENSKPLTERFAAKQADSMLLLHPLDVPYNNATAGLMLDYYSKHTISTGPAMTNCINSIVAARLGRGQQSLDEFQSSYRPFMRGPWDAFSEKRTLNNTYFITGMAGSLQSVFYGFAGLQARTADQKGRGVKIAGDKIASLYCDPHLPPGWGGLTLNGIKFRGHTFNLTIDQGNKPKVTPVL